MTKPLDIETAKQYYIDMLSGELADNKKESLNIFLNKNPATRKEFEMLELIWKATDVQKRPPKSPEMSKKLQNKLKNAAKDEGETLDLDF